MQFNIHDFKLYTPESWLIVLIFAGFWIYSYYSLALLLIHTYKRDRLISQQSTVNSQQSTTLDRCI